MGTVQLLILTGPIQENRAHEVLGKLKKTLAAHGIRQVGRFPSAAPSVLTPRQTEVLRGIALGTSVKEIARQLDISTKTVETHRAQLMKRLGTRRIPELVRYALQSGAVPAAWLGKHGPRTNMLPTKPL